MKRATIIGISVASAALLAAACTAAWVLTRPPGPADAAEQYLAALADGDGRAALELIDPLPADADDLSAAFDGADAMIASPRVDEVAESGDTASADVSFELAGSEHSATFSLVRSASGWSVASDALGTATTTTTLGDTVLIGGVAIVADGPQPLLPAAYTVAAAPAGILGGDAAITVLPGEDAEAAIEAQVLDEATTVAQRQLDAYADACAAATDAVPENCGIRIPWAADLETLASVAFRIDGYPQLRLSEDADAFIATDGVLVATVTGDARAGGADAFTYRTTQWTLRGDVSFTGGQMVLAVR
ncbi:hypothetical protein [Microbacterium thalassium]|uniref:Uncharacterized protein n=1 Tax=Microbacterium thalassium TaxID=362649 RepID=A0A7X0FRK0_9MICO|nr:hypothetical protein [Microbacterium thalassium]MBB6392397.1 hypothetical protein [Microbacterium thalassium]GLK25070.1 hypothetical protein GCM10017607_23880 [Microbacterium thalassium]